MNNITRDGLISRSVIEWKAPKMCNTSTMALQITVINLVS